jgi:carbonic anhydrase
MSQRGLQVHGWVFDVSNGLARPLDISSEGLEAAYQVGVGGRT